MSTRGSAEEEDEEEEIGKGRDAIATEFGLRDSQNAHKSCISLVKWAMMHFRLVVHLTNSKCISCLCCRRGSAVSITAKMSRHSYLSGLRTLEA